MNRYPAQPIPPAPHFNAAQLQALDTYRRALIDVEVAEAATKVARRQGRPASVVSASRKAEATAAAALNVARDDLDTALTGGT